MILDLKSIEDGRGSNCLCSFLGVGHDELNGLEMKFLNEDQVGRKPSRALILEHTEAALGDSDGEEKGCLRGLD